VSVLAGVLAQAGDTEPLGPLTPFDRPGIDWWGIMPLLLLAAPAMVLLHVSSLLRKVFAGFYALATIVIALAAGGFAIGLFWRVNDDDHGPFAVLHGAVGVDGFSVYVTMLLCASVILAALLADDFLRREGLEGAELYVLMLLSASGGVIMASANDLVVMFVGLEILSIAAYVLASAHTKRSTSQEAGMKYFVLGAFSSAFFLYGIALVYGATGTTNLLQIRTTLADQPFFDNDALLLAGLALLLVGFGFKVAAVPFHAWTPDVYQGSPSPIVAYMASGVKAGAFAGLLRVFVVGFAGEAWNWQPIVYALAVATLLGGAVLAVVQTDVKRMMAYSSINHAGFILVGVQAATAKGVQAALFYLAAYTFMVAGAFGVITIVSRRGDDRTSIDDYRGLAATNPTLALTFTVLLLAQAGVPLTSGFFAKFGVISAAMDARSYWLGIIAMVSAVIAAFVYLRIVVAMFMTSASEHAEEAGAGLPSDAGEGGVVEPAPSGEGAGGVATLTQTTTRLRVPATATLALAITVGVTLVVGFLPGLLTSLAKDAVPVLLSSK
jgi:NADH-quinone oxidoreductase subunit N